MPPQTTPIRFTTAQAHALAKVGRGLRPQIEKLFRDGRHRSAITRAFDLIDDRIDGAVPDPFDLDLEHFGDHFADLKSAEMAVLIRARVRDLLATLILWRAVEDLSVVADTSGLLGVPEVDSTGWRAEVLDLLLDRGHDVVLPGE